MSVAPAPRDLTPLLSDLYTQRNVYTLIYTYINKMNLQETLAMLSLFVDILAICCFTASMQRLMIKTHTSPRCDVCWFVWEWTPEAHVFEVLVLSWWNCL